MIEKPKILVTCPPMAISFELMSSRYWFNKFEFDCRLSTGQVWEEAELIKMVPEYDVWIAGDDPVSRSVAEAGVKGRLSAVVKWGVGIDNVDSGALKQLGIYFNHTPAVFGDEVAEIAIAYLISCLRKLVEIDKQVRLGSWYKPTGRSLSGSTIGVVGLGDIGFAIADRLKAFDVEVIGYDPRFKAENSEFRIAEWPNAVRECDGLIFCCSLTKSSFHMFDTNIISSLKKGCVLVNVSRGSVVSEKAILHGLESGKISAVALDVFEQEPVSPCSSLFDHENVIFGSHNASNTAQAVVRATDRAMEHLMKDVFNV